MRAVVAREFGAPERFSMETLPARPPGAEEVCVKIQAAGVSFVDALIAAGKYQVKPPIPFTPGTEFSGIVESVGNGVRALKPGDRVCGSVLCGGFAEQITVPARAVSPAPAIFGFDEAAVFRVSYTTAYHALVQRGMLVDGESVLVLGGGGAIGTAAIQVAKSLGARVIAAASKAEKRALAISSGADSAIDSNRSNWYEQVKSWAGTGGIDIVVDPVGGAMSEPAFRTLNWKGRHLVLGFASGDIARLPLNLPLLKGAALLGVDIAQFNEKEPVVAAENYDRLLALCSVGALRPRVALRFRLEEFSAAIRAVRDGHTAGRVVLQIAS